MKQSAIAMLATAGMASALTQQCTGSAVNEGGNFFCGAVDHILYQGLNSKGSYEAVTNMLSTGECKKASKAYGGPLAPLDQDLSLHIRGPIYVEEVAVYNLSGENKKKREVATALKKAHPRGHQHFHKLVKEKRAEYVTATINGEVVSWEKVYYGPKTEAPAPAAPAAAPTPAPASSPAEAIAKAGALQDSSASNDKSKTTNKPSKSNKSGQDWDRVAYYNAKTQEVDNMVFMANYGGESSGVFDTTWGNSISFLNADGNGGAASPQTLKRVFIPSNKEFAIFSGEPCDETCGFSRDDSVAYKGFAGGHKIFLFNFKMPLDGNRGFNGDMPAIWALNAAIPRCAQYNACSCWPNCGEFDIFEVLAKGDNKCKSTLHLANGGGSSDYFVRPVDKFIKAAVVFDQDSASMSIKVLPSDTDFSQGLDDETVTSWITGQGNKAGGKILSSLFQLAGQ